uniref:Uncharacterized protein n=1 Tax=Heliothis virescens TaxID=7102 RepID=A0A2A4JWT6_HELVI
MVQLPFYLQNSALRRVKTAQQTAARRMQVITSDDFSTSLQRSVSARRLSSTSELMSSQERIKGQAARERRLRPSESVASSVASGLHRGATGAAGAGAADLNRVLLTDDYFSDVNPRSMRRLMNVLYVTGRLLKAFQIEFNWYQLASWVNLTEQWPFRTSWIIYHHETYEEHIDDSTSLKHIYEKVKPLMSGLREASTLMELDRDERKLEVFLSFHRATLTAADLKIFLPFTINLDPYIKKLIKEEQMQSGVEEDAGAGGAAGVMWGQPHSRQPHSKLFPRKHRSSAPTQPAAAGPVPPQQMWVGWANTGSGFVPQPLNPQHFPQPQFTQQPQPTMNPFHMIRTAFPAMTDVPNIRLSTLSVERVCSMVREALGAGGQAAADALQRHNVCGLVLAVCRLQDLEPVLELPFGDWELFKLLIVNLRELEANMPSTVPAVAVMSEKSAEVEIDSTAKPRHTLETQRSRPSNVEKQVTLEEQMICGALQTLNEEALEDVLQSEPPSHPVKPLMSGLREASTLMELDRDERKLEVFLSFHRATLTAADLKIFLPFTINLDPYIKKLIKEEQMQSGVEEDAGAGGAAGVMWGQPHSRQPHSKLFPRKHRSSAPTQPAAAGPVPPQQMWVGWANTGSGFVPQPLNPQHFPQPQFTQQPQPTMNPFHMIRTAFPAMTDVPNIRLSTLSVERVCSMVREALGAGGQAAADALQRHNVCGLVLAVCRLQDLEPVLELPFGDWELFKLLIVNLRELEANMPSTVPAVAVMSEKSAEVEIDSTAKPRHTLETQRSRPSNVEKQVTLEEQMICGALQTLNEEALEDVLQSEPPSHPDEESTLQLRLPASQCGTPAGSPRALRRDPSILKGGSFRRRPPGDPPAVTFNVENEDDSDDDGQITAELSPRSDVTELESPRDVGAAFDLLPGDKGAGGEARGGRLRRADSSGSLGNMVEPYNLRLLAHGTVDSARALWRQDALDAGPPWPWDEPDSAV